MNSDDDSRYVHLFALLAGKPGGPTALLTEKPKKRKKRDQGTGQERPGG